MASQTSSLKKGQREAFFSVVDTWFSAAADYLSLLGEEEESWGSGYPRCGIGDSLPSNRFD